MNNHYLKTKMKAMGKWLMQPADSENWQGEHTSRYHEEKFGFPKGLLTIYTLEDGMAYDYAPEDYFSKFKEYLDTKRKQGLKELEKEFKTFYGLKKEFFKEVPKLSADDYSKLSSEELVEMYEKNRDWAHRVTVYDQFSWLADNSWQEDMDSTLAKYGLEKGSEDYYTALFALTKPEEISTTLEEKKEVLEYSLKIKNGDIEIEEAAEYLSKKFGYMPLFCFGEPWGADYYAKEVESLLNKNVTEMQKEIQPLQKYTELRNKDFAAVKDKYGISDEDVQIFIDYGLSLDARNEAEYCVSLATYYLLPIYKEMAKRLYVSVKQLRMLFENEIVQAMRGEIDALESIEAKGKYVAYGFTKDMSKRINFSPEESKAIFEHIESYVEPVQSGEDGKGVCGSPGKVEGIARVIHGPDENDKVKEGDVLITNGTSVDFLPAMKRAVAIVTEIGGLTCHAAVVSREFGIPCVLALNKATEIFKSGEKIEVDANNGVVRKI